MGPFGKGMRLAFGWIDGSNRLSRTARIPLGGVPEGWPHPRKWELAYVLARFHGDEFNEPRPPITDEQRRRKERSEARLRSEGVPTLAWLPLIESEDELEPRGAEEVADRLRALTAVAAKADAQDQGRPPVQVLEMMKRSMHGPIPAALFTPDELDFVRDFHTAEKDLAQFVWRYEAAWVLLWALRWIEAPLSMPSEFCDLELLRDIVRSEPDLTVRGLRPLAELLDEADLIYRYHWASRSALNQGLEPPAGLSQDVIVERHHALNWLIRFENAEWDEVRCGT